MRIMVLLLNLSLIASAHAAVGDPIPEKVRKFANLTSKEKVEKLINKNKPSIHLNRNPEEYQYLKNIASGRSYYYRSRYRKTNDRKDAYYVNVEPDRELQSFYKPYTPANHLTMKRFYPRKKKIHYRELFKFGPYKRKQS